MEEGPDRERYERLEVLPVATENVGQLKFYTANPSVTQFKLKEFGLKKSDCPTVVVHDTVGGFGGGKRFYLPPAALRGALELEALRAFVRYPRAAGNLDPLAREL